MERVVVGEEDLQYQRNLIDIVGEGKVGTNIIIQHSPKAKVKILQVPKIVKKDSIVTKLRKQGEVVKKDNIINELMEETVKKDDIISELQKELVKKDNIINRLNKQLISLKGWVEHQDH